MVALEDLTDGQAGGFDGTRGVLLGQLTHLGHGGLLHAEGLDVADGGAELDLGAGARRLADDVARGDGVAVCLGRVTDAEAGGADGIGGIGGGPREIGHGHGLDPEADDVVDGRSGVDGGVGGRAGAGDVARDDGVAEGLGAVARGEAGVVDGVERVGLGQVDDVGHRRPARDRCS